MSAVELDEAIHKGTNSFISGENVKVKTDPELDVFVGNTNECPPSVKVKGAREEELDWK